ncbi:class I SAM-dependent methyltransferase [Pseudomonas gingeri]|uniref:Class I SAM-dependent methyltransferase n=1 Tax=Pseudomonas gingeri TaxID=117681 RepID=A0A7Y7YGM8_9PSED|nr:class I SAM-dependent methyltransferase [Pseudomonas gingeri]NWA01629.1 class I SAM-dependent methyltransferase [Pseudomonas gingeri]NWA13568.1 class I SAM-dependent methyltransferase [Pseudomonas gingeri]NWA53072.1 class I SAM-dependent methyltransferase [Pseudomonas gingeri]NWA96569.1 class I SAM-dependent methyltransferase [Pseudomonas gingeri]NWA99794.1 class I SAM-dependent methyltransferase [Pseudomonas gingeri]
MNRTLVALSFTALLAPALAQAAIPATISDGQYAKVLAGNWRAPENSVRDVYRHPRQTLQFFGLQANQTVIEITPGGGWYSEVLAPLLKDHGQYIAAVQATATSDYAKRSADGLKQKFAKDPTHYAKAAVVEFDPQAPVLGKPDSADRVLTFRNVHNWVMADDAPAMFSAFFKVLKPGGVLGVVDHRAKDGADLESIRQSGYLPTTYVVKLATDAGFVLEGQSEINANPKDTKDYAGGVWTLPPSLRLGEQDKARYLAIGESDRLTLRFVKPGKVAAR